jgi:hypothetical protein
MKTLVPMHGNVLVSRMNARVDHPAFQVKADTEAFKVSSGLQSFFSKSLGIDISATLQQESFVGNDLYMCDTGYHHTVAIDDPIEDNVSEQTEFDSIDSISNSQESTNTPPKLAVATTQGTQLIVPVPAPVLVLRKFNASIMDAPIMLTPAAAHLLDHWSLDPTTESMQSLFTAVFNQDTNTQPIQRVRRKDLVKNYEANKIAQSQVAMQSFFDAKASQAATNSPSKSMTVVAVGKKAEFDTMVKSTPKKGFGISGVNVVRVSSQVKTGSVASGSERIVAESYLNGKTNRTSLASQMDSRNTTDTEAQDSLIVPSQTQNELIRNRAKVVIQKPKTVRKKGF